MSADQRSESTQAVVNRLQSRFPESLIDIAMPRGEVTMTVLPDALKGVALTLRDEFGFDMLVDVSGIDYLTFGSDEWSSGTEVSSSGFSRGVEGSVVGRFRRGEQPHGAGADDVDAAMDNDGKRFAAVLHLLSVQHNFRLRVRAFAADNELPVVPSVTEIWPGANWFEREAFDLYGIIFEGHPDLRRILTDYGFVGHPFRKDFPLIGNVEVRYDEDQRRVIYEPVSIEPRIGVPRVIRDDSRFETSLDESERRHGGDVR